MSSKFVIYQFVTLIFMGFLMGCENDSSDLEKMQTEDDYLIFGTYSGFCFGEACVEIFKIENEQLYEDVSDQYPFSDNLPLSGNFKLLPEEKYKLVADIANNFPEKLMEEINLVLGMPDAYDQGGIYVELRRNDKIQYWVLDRDRTNLSEYLHSWVDLINEKVELLQ